MLQGTAIIGQSGGPTSVINASLAGIIEAAANAPAIRRTLGMRLRHRGLHARRGHRPGRGRPGHDCRTATTPSSPRWAVAATKFKDTDFPKILDDAAEVRHPLLFLDRRQRHDGHHPPRQSYSRAGLRLVGVGVPKAVDNDLCGTDHTPGFGSCGPLRGPFDQAGRHVGPRHEARQPVCRFPVRGPLGRLAARRRGPGQSRRGRAPHIILLPERPFDQERFLGNMKHCHDRYGWCSIVCGEGVCHADGTPISAPRK